MALIAAYYEEDFPEYKIVIIEPNDIMRNQVNNQVSGVLQTTEVLTMTQFYSNDKCKFKVVLIDEFH